MNFLGLLKLSSRNLFRRKLRTFLTVISVAIGTASIVIMLSLGFAIQKQDQDWITQMGALTEIQVESYGLDGREIQIDDKKIKELEEIENIKSVLPFVYLDAQLITRDGQSYTQIKGVDVERLKKAGFELLDGEMLTKNDEYGFIYTNLEFIDSSNDYEWVPLELDPMKEKITLRLGYKDNSIMGSGEKTYEDFKVKALGKIEGSSSYDASVYMNLDTVKDLYIKEQELYNMDSKISKKDIYYSQVIVKVNDISDVKEVQDNIENLGYMTYSSNDFNEGLEERNALLNAVLGGIGGVSLLVAAIGISNTMIMSIYERTKEIGVIKVIGASVKDIRNMFLLEATLIGFIGGALGIALSYLGSYILNFFAGSSMDYGGEITNVVISYIPAGLVIIAGLFSMLIGLASGYLPAIKATKISAIDAIRTN